jgi:hypothetical protein
MTAYPFLAIFAGRGFMVASDALTGLLPKLEERFKVLSQVGLQVGLGVLCVLGPLLITAHSHPFGLSTYVPFVGGTAGGADLGLNRQFWGYTTQNANAEYMEKNAPQGAAVFMHDTAWESWARMQDEKRVRPDLRGVGAVGDSQIALIQHELHMSEVDYQIWVAYGTDAPVYVVTHDGVPIVSIYRR